MSLLDTVHSRCPDINRWLKEDGPYITRDLGETMGDFWVTPAGELFEVDTRDAFSIEFQEGPYPSAAWVPTGRNIKLRPYYFSGEISLYSKLGPRESWRHEPQVNVVFERGLVQEVHVGTWEFPPVRKIGRI